MPSWLRLVTLTCMILIDISAFLGNLLVICAFFRTRRLQTVTNYFIASLAFADALVAIFVLPLSIYCYQRDRSWKLGLILCDLWVSSDVLLCTSSILNLACISVDRYMAITKPLTYTAYRSKFLARVMILLVWIVSFVITCPPIFGWRDKNRRQTVEEHHRCDLNSARGYVVYSALGSFYIPGVVMIFVYIRIFMVVYDRENLIKRFHSNTSSIINNSTSNLIAKSNANSAVNEMSMIATHKSKFQKVSSCCCFCFSTKPPTLSPYMCSDQKQNGYLIYRFTTNNNNNNNNNNSSNKYSSTTNSPGHSPTTLSKTSLFCRPCPKAVKNMSNCSDDIYPYRRNYSANTSSDYQVRVDDIPCYELKPCEESTSPLLKCRSRSFEHTSLSKIRDLNSELSHSRQLKAAAVAAAAAISGTSKIPQPRSNDFDQQIDLSNNIFSAMTDNSRQAAQSLHELTQLPLIQDPLKYRKTPRQHLNVFPMRARATTNPPKVQEMITASPSSSPSLKQKQIIVEPTRINRRIKSSRSINSSPSAILIENIKQQHRITRNSSIKSTPSSRSLVSIRHITQSSENSNENNSPKPKMTWCCCSCFNSSTQAKILSQTVGKQVFVYTPNHSLTIDDEDDDKLSSSDNTTRAPLYACVPSSSITRVSSNGTGAPGDVHRRERIRFMKEQKTAKTLAVVVGGFILLWLPFFIMYVIPQETHSLNPQTVTLITWLGYFNSVINPFIYAYCSKQFRMAFWNITFGLCMKRSSVLSPLTNKNKQLHQRRLNA
ncbi:unnamed protein product [Adineta ricciae]|uniref:G-protein coupled receptors family 1 profile domain-containing protein n=1 Tax=Adineta ricciae TaxID=249248 RepID=A0A813U7N4_ADIRI|nr:unnamed protein product [Adineta ricciae]